MAWPTTITVGSSTMTRENCSDGYVYRVTGVNCPHITIHGVRGSAGEATFDDWKQSGGVFHIKYYSGPGSLWEYCRGESYAFATQSGRKTTNKGAEEPQANALAKSFWDEMKAK